MKQEQRTDGTQQATGRDEAALKNRRSFLVDAGKYGALLVGGSYLAGAAGLENRARADDAPAEGWDVKEKLDMIRVLAVGRRAPGMLRGDIRRKTFISWTGYGAAVLSDVTKVRDNRQAVWFIQNFTNEAAFGVEGDTQCLPFVERDFVAEYFQPTGKTVVQTMQGGPTLTPEEQAAAAAARAGQANGRGGQGQRGPTMPPSGENGTDLRIVAKQVLSQGKRPLGEPGSGHDKGMHFLKLSANIARADQVKTWQALHEKAMAAAPVYASELAGYELLQRIENTPDKQMSRCGAEMPVPELVACLWSKSKRGAQEFPTYARALYKADQQKAMDAPSSFYLMAEEWEVWVNQEMVR